MLWYASRVLSDHNSVPRVFHCLCGLPFRHTGSSHVSWRHLHSCKYDWPLEWEGMPALLTWSLLQVMIHFNLAFFHFVLSSLASLFCADKSMLSSSQLFYHNSLIQGKKYNLRYSFWLRGVGSVNFGRHLKAVWHHCHDTKKHLKETVGSICENVEVIQKVQPSGKSSTISSEAICPCSRNLNSKVPGLL